MIEMIRVLVTDDHAIVRDGISLVLETVEGMEVVGEAANGQEALELTEKVQPDVVLMDLHMPVMDGLTAIQHLQTQYPQIAIVILTTYNEDELMFKGLQAGARGYLLKDMDRETLIRTIMAAASGETLLQPDILTRVLSQAGAQQEPSSSTPVDTDLTERELEVLRAVATGERNKEIAYRLDISERTVKAHLTNIYNKLGVDSRAAAIAVAARTGLLPG